MFSLVDRFRARLAWALALGAASFAIGCSSGDQLLGNIIAESSDIRPDAAPPRQDASNACTILSYPAQEIGRDLAIYFTVDGSAALLKDPNSWDLLVSGFTDFIHSPDVNRPDIGIHFFPINSNPDACNRCGRDCGCFSACGCPCDARNDPPRNCQRGVSCDPGTYQRPVVEIAPMPLNGGPLATSFPQQPFGPTTIRPALRGALDYTATYAVSHPEQRVVEVLVVGGPPSSECGPSSIADVADVAASSNIRTYVVGYDYWDGPPLDPIAQRGGGRLYHFDSDRGDTAKRFAGVVDDIRREPHCEYNLPSGPGIDLGNISLEVNLTVDAGWGPATRLSVNPVKNREACGNGGDWYYDRSDRPTRIIVCEDTCRKIHGPTESSVVINVGCATQRPPP